MSPTIDELLPLSKALKAESNDLNKTIAAISDKLAALNLGIEVWITSEFAPEYDVGFGKVSEAVPGGEKKWQLACRMGHNTHAYAEPLLSASRDLRIEGLKLVPTIVATLQDEAQERIRIMQEAKKQAAEL